jgi:hypothetical protein
MNIRHPLSLLFGSILVHAVVTACTSTATDAQADGLPLAPVTDAAAGGDAGACGCPPARVEVAAEQCIGGQAEHAYAGLTKYEIAARVSNWTGDPPDAGFTGLPPGYELRLQSNVFTKDGFASVPCFEGTTTYFVYRP